VDNLIEMVAKLKNEKNLYKIQVKRHNTLVKEYIHRWSVDGLPAYLNCQTPEADKLRNDSCLPLQYDTFHKSEEANGVSVNNWCSMTVPSHRASTVTTCLSTPDMDWLTDDSDMDRLFGQHTN
jgi:hypothetical protein